VANCRGRRQDLAGCAKFLPVILAPFNYEQGRVTGLEFTDDYRIAPLFHEGGQPLPTGFLERLDFAAISCMKL
jgi:hypothetical protein